MRAAPRAVSRRSRGAELGVAAAHGCGLVVALGVAVVAYLGGLVLVSGDIPAASDAGAFEHTLAGAIAAVAGGAVVALVLRSFGGAVGSEVAVFLDRVEHVVGSGRRAFELAALRELRVVPAMFGSDLLELVLVFDGERRLRLEGRGSWPIAELADRIARTARPLASQRIAAALDAGEEVTFREPVVRARTSLALGAVVAVVGVGSVAVGLANAAVPDSWRSCLNAFKGVKTAISCFVVATTLIVRWRLSRRRGFVLTRTGLREVGADSVSEVRWSDVRAVTTHPQGDLVVEAEDDRTLRLSRAAANALLIGGILRARVPAPAWREEASA